MTDTTDRHRHLRDWLTAQLHTADWTLTAASADASFRRYWRVFIQNSTNCAHFFHSETAGNLSNFSHESNTAKTQTFIVMDAPPPMENCGRFADLSRHFRTIGVTTPEIYAEDRTNGFLLLTDFGERVYLNRLTAATANRLYGDALGALATIQSCGAIDDLPQYDAAFLQRELALFDEWFLHNWLALPLNENENAMLKKAKAVLVASALEQPQVCVHRDFHSRNLMHIAHGNPGVLDFQDAVIGPVTYDLVSLLRDCYIVWPEQQVQEWALGYQQLAQQMGIVRSVAPAQFLRWFDRMGVQRHLKVCGIFARLHLRDGKSHYLGDLPRVLRYLIDVTGRDVELKALHHFLIDRVVAPVQQKCASSYL